MSSVPFLTRYRLLAAAVIGVVLLLGLWFWHSIGPTGGAERYPIAWFIIIAAVVGALVNQPFRHESPTGMGGGWVIGYVAWKCLVAVVFAFVLYLMFAGQMISGDLFPRFVRNTLDNGGAYVNMADFATRMKPESYKDVAKLLVWSFVAGYSERLVPNLITQILKSAEAGKGK